MDRSDVKRILAAPEKGNFFEKSVSQLAWKPLYSVESEDGSRWSRMLRVVHEITRTINVADVAETVHTIPEYNNFANCRDVTRVVACTMARMVFNKELSQLQCDLFHNASMEWRKEIAMKGVGDTTVKWAFIREIEDMIPRRYFDMIDDRMEVISAFAQPFFISPMINVSDIFAGIELLYGDVIVGTNIAPKAMIGRSIELYPPFPTLERQTGPTEQTFLFLYPENNRVSPDVSISPDGFGPETFGYGPRKCAGQQLAMNLMCAMLDTIERPFTPIRGSKYSGRHNDDRVDIQEGLFLVTTMTRLMWNGVTRDTPKN
jgi:hypothetical protein